MSIEPDSGRELDLNARLDALESSQRSEAPRPRAIFERETRRVRIPPGGELPESAALLERFYGGGFTVREKKPMVVDTRRSSGPYMVSVDARPLTLLDACSQIATLTHGFYHPGIVKALYTGRFDHCLWSNPDTTVHHVPELAAYEEALERLAPPALDHVSFVCAGGAEANEKALRIARLHAPPPVDGPRRRVLAFRDGFHGRTLATLAATWNPDKRAPFEFEGYEAVFSHADLDEVERLLDARGHEIYAIVVEPMQAEGGDVYLRREFLLGLCKLARARKLPLVVDEVQTGFATGGPFFWWTRLGLGGDEATAPDILTCAKKAGLGVVLSRWPDPESNQVHVASALRGLIQLETSRDQTYLESLLRPRAEALAAAFPGLVGDVRLAGTALAFDLPDTAAQTAFIDQRYQRGLMTYPAGERTIRFRFSAGWDERVVDDLFKRIHESLARLSDKTAKDWVPEGQTADSDPAVIVRPIEERDWPQIMVIENTSYEPARRDSEAYLRRAAATGLGLCAVDTASGSILGFCFGGPLEGFRGVSGASQDERLGLGDTFYSADVTVAEAARARGVGRLLKRAQVQWAKVHGFSYVSGRNRVGTTDAMAGLNRSYGAFPVVRLTHQYEGNALADYYRIPLVPPPVPRAPNDEGILDLASGLQQPFGATPAFMAGHELVGPTASRINLSNYATVDTVHYSEHLRLLAPRGTGHMYFTSSRDETVDKALRCLRLSRPQGQLAVGLQGGYLGHVTAAARSLSDPAGFGDGLALFEFPRLPHPEDDPAGFEAGLKDLVERQGADKILGLFVEVVGERSGRVLAGEPARVLAAACRAHDIPLVLVEAASGCYRTGGAAWGVDTLPTDVVPDMVLWYPGGQIGHIFVGDRYFIKKPLVLISTWDGDELSAIRAHEHLRAARRLDLAESIAALDELLQHDVLPACPGARLGGVGLYRTITFPSVAVAEAVDQACLHRGLYLGNGLPDTLVFAPPLTISPATITGDLRRRVLAAIDEARSPA
ncbi:aminotransferase class III-fold pyridoxal phosphate-dependent enzyme [Nannocystis bainbridge]|uniref:Aminotransferase class III-fold pyridoxal phosphate-dependent enzyme n=1 Tax=Nannocystis bainbridge TaxID=2995303 RepID=A0ABT5E0N1_9BACT|nr:aminotransferase class III-fold pyridoxal phosphate-dependent enzyme [Nannocystis bainbridge]MDC0718970.1 aminotransferase class III-fold pyridoxal phosphate-dependent enzyme [Nannocystis bainbridge]